MKTTPDEPVQEILTGVKQLTKAGARDIEAVIDEIKEAIEKMPDQLKSQTTVKAEFIDSFVFEMADKFSRIRRIDALASAPKPSDVPLSSTPEAMLNDLLDARALLSYKVLQGEIPFVQLEAPSYGHLEGSWLRRVKQLLAYFIWEIRVKHNQSGSASGDFFEAAKVIRGWLLERPRADLGGFERVKSYLQQRYLGSDGRLDHTKAETKALIGNKAYRIWQNTGETNPDLNWSRAKLYVTMFYESIVGAVIDDNKRKTATLLKAFEFSKSPDNGYVIINAFEAALAINFLNKAVLAELKNKPSSFDFSFVPVNDWPDDLVKVRFKNDEGEEGEFRYEKNNGQIIYDGEMTEDQCRSLQVSLVREHHRIALDQLLSLSRRKPLDEMFL